jgi:glutaconate CoA-transferase subunit B
MTAQHTLHDIITVAVARSLKDGEVGFTGLATGGPAALFATAIPLAAMGLAHRMHAPNLTILLAGWCHNPDLSRLDALPDAEFDSRMRDLECEAQMIEYPGQFALKRGDIDFGFSSGVQVDRQGNLNSVCVGPYERPKVRLVGPILVPEHMTLFRREYVMMPHHEARNLVERVDFVAGVGYPGGEAGRRALGLDWGGPEMVVTPKCIFDFDREAGTMRVRTIHPGVTREELQAGTGFDLGELGGVPSTPEPTGEELEILRRDVDPKGILLPRP